MLGTTDQHVLLMEMSTGGMFADSDFFISVTHHCCSTLPQVTDNFDRQDFNKMCWTLCSRKNLDLNQLYISNNDAFKIWCIFNFLSEDRYPLIIVTEEVNIHYSSSLLQLQRTGIFLFFLLKKNWLFGLL